MLATNVLWARTPKWAYIFGTMCPAKGKGAGVVMPWCDTQAMAEHLKAISLPVDPSCHAILMLDQGRCPRARRTEFRA